MLTLIRVGFLGIFFAVGGGVKLPKLCLKPVRIMLETWKMVRKYTLTCSVWKYTFSYWDPLNFADVRIFLAKNQHFLGKIVPLLKSVASELC